MPLQERRQVELALRHEAVVSLGHVSTEEPVRADHPRPLAASRRPVVEDDEVIAGIVEGAQVAARREHRPVGRRPALLVEDLVAQALGEPHVVLARGAPQLERAGPFEASRARATRLREREASERVGLGPAWIMIEGGHGVVQAVARDRSM